jgi:hypothetical protein
MANARDELRTLDAEPGQFAFFAWKNVTIMVWEVPPNAASVTRLSRMGAERAREHPGALSDVHVINGWPGLPSAEVRAALAEASREAVTHLAAVAVVLGGTGFWASALRGFITGLHVLVRGPFEVRLFGSIEDVAQWLPEVHAKRTDVVVSPAELERVLLEAQTRALALRARHAS